MKSYEQAVEAIDGSLTTMEVDHLDLTLIRRSTGFSSRPSRRSRTASCLKNEQPREIAETYDATVAQLSVRSTLQLGLLPLPKTRNPEHMKSNADVDFEISQEDMETLKNVDRIGDYGEHSTFPVFGRARTWWTMEIAPSQADRSLRRR